ncbi:MAG TPA: adenine deaminase [Chloroflexota bacterium]|nr:adenine deaminase [Chloroflexota bacterium]
MDRAALIRVARGEEPADLLLEGAEIVNVLSGEIYPADVAIHQGWIVGLGDRYEAKSRVDMRGLTLLPGLIEGHIHIESTMLSVPEFARAVLARGTTTAIVDPHELANVLGLEGIRMVLRWARQVPLEIHVQLPSCVPASPFETAGAVLDAAALRVLVGEAGILGLGELMNFPGALAGDPDLLAKAGLFGPDGHVDGHAPGVRGRDLSAYVVAGPRTDHESVSEAEAEEKLRKGMWLLVREGSTERNLHELLPLIRRLRPARAAFCSDDITPNHLLREGHLDAILRQSVAGGLDPITAVRMATIQTAQCFGLPRRGAIAPGYAADLVAVDDLHHFRAAYVYKMGRLVARDGQVMTPLPVPDTAGSDHTVYLPPLNRHAFRLRGHEGDARVIGIIPGQIVTEDLLLPAPHRDGELVADPERDIAKLAVIERHGGGGRIGIGLVRGLGLRAGALASTVAHDAHNVVVAGMNDEDMIFAAQHLGHTGGGVVVVAGGEVRAELPLPIAGLLSPLPIAEIAARLDALDEMARALGSTLAHPLMTLSFLALSVIPALKLTDQGLVDVERFALALIQDG